MPLPADWYIDQYGSERVLDPERVEAEVTRLRMALMPFAEAAPEDESEIDYLVSEPGAVANARAAYKRS